MKPIEALARSSTGSALETRPAAKKIVAIIGAESAAGLGLVRAILEDLKSELAPRAIVRSLESAESRQLKKMGTELLVADPRDESALTRVLRGAYGAFYIQLSSEHPSPETKLATAHTVARAAKQVGLRHVIWATLEDPGQTFLEQHDVTPTFQNGRWMSDGEGQTRPEQIFTEMEIPTTFLHTAWEATVAAGTWTEDIGKHAYGLLRDPDSIGQTVSISASRMIRRPTPAPVPVATDKSEPVTARALTPVSSTASLATSSPSAKASAAPAIVPPVEPASIKSAPTPAKSRKIIMIGLVVVGVLVGMAVMRQLQSQKVVPAPEPTESARAAEAVRPPPGAVKGPEAQPVVPSAVAAPPPVAAPPEAPLPPAESAAPEEMVVGSNQHSAGKHSGAGKNHKRVASKTTAVASSSPPPPAAPAPAPAVAAVNTEAPPKIETPPERAPPVAPPAPALAAAPKAPVSAASAPPPPMVPVTPRPGFVDPKAVNIVVRSHADEANACYERAKMEHPDLHGRLTIHAVIDPSGRVLSVSPTSNVSEGARLQSCLVRAFNSWVFPRPAGGANGNVTYSFSFEAQ